MAGEVGRSWRALAESLPGIRGVSGEGCDTPGSSEESHQPKNVLLQSRQVARAPPMAMSLCGHFPPRAQRRPDLSGFSCL